MAKLLVTVALAFGWSSQVFADETTRIAVVANTSMDEARFEELSGALTAHLSGLPVTVAKHRVADHGFSGKPGQLRAFAIANSYELAFWVADSGGTVVFVDTADDTDGASIIVNDGAESWTSRCEVLGSLLLALSEPRLGGNTTEVDQVEESTAPVPVIVVQPRAPRKKPESAPKQETEVVEPEPVEDQNFEENEKPEKGRSWRFGVAPRVGVDFPFSRLKPFVMVGLGAEIFFAVLDRRLSLGLDFTYTQPSFSGKGHDAGFGNFSYETTVLQLKTAVDVYYRFFLESSLLVPYLGAGPVFQFISTSQTSTLSGGVNENHSFEFGGEVVVGAGLKLGVGRLFVDARAVYTDLNQELTGDTNAGNATISAGYMFFF